jgi:hypothetical protein
MIAFITFLFAIGIVLLQTPNSPFLLMTGLAFVIVAFTALAGLVDSLLKHGVAYSEEEVKDEKLNR